METYIQTAYEDQLVKVQPVDSEFCNIHLKKIAKGFRYYVITPESPTESLIDKYVHCTLISSYFYKVICNCIDLYHAFSEI